MDPPQHLITELQCRRSGRKRRIVNYKSAKQNYTVENAKKKQRKKSKEETTKPIPRTLLESTRPTVEQTPPATSIQPTEDAPDQHLLETSDQDTLQTVTKMLQDAPPGLVQNSVFSGFDPTNNNMMQAIPATVQTKPIAITGNGSGIIMQGLINTGTSQTTCYLIPININDLSLVSGLPVGTKVFGNTTTPIILPLTTSSVYPGQATIIEEDLPDDHTEGAAVKTPEHFGNTVHITNNINIPNINISIPALQTDTAPSVTMVTQPSVTMVPQSNVNMDTLSHVTMVTRPSNTILTQRNVTLVPQPSVTMVTQPSVTMVTHPNTTMVTAVKEDKIELSDLIAVLQSTDNLSQIINQLTYDEMIAILDILKNSEAETPLAPLECSDLLKTPSADALNKSVSHVLPGTGPISPQEEDEDFNHVEMEEPGEHSNTKCVMCGEKFKDKTEFTKHMRHHLFMHRYSCYECGYGTSSMNQLIIHKSQNHEGDLMKITSDFLQQSQKTPIVPNPDVDNTLAQCPVCNMDVRIAELNSHMSYHRAPWDSQSSGSTPPRSKHKCQLCGAVLVNKTESSEHAQHHKAGGKLQCYYCSDIVETPAELKAHTFNIHPTVTKATKKPFKCTQCARTFSGGYHLQRHIKTVHEDRRDFKCSECGKSFVELHCLRRHIRNIHNQIRDHTCPVCTRGFTYRQDMFRHIMSVHQKIRDIRCPLCRKTFYHRYFIGHAARVHDLTVKYRDGICYVYNDAGQVIHKIT